jgi:hypothetical protein
MPNGVGEWLRGKLTPNFVKRVQHTLEGRPDVKGAPTGTPRGQTKVPTPPTKAAQPQMGYGRDAAGNLVRVPIKQTPTGDLSIKKF